jgi:hypothetical protein
MWGRLMGQARKNLISRLVNEPWLTNVNPHPPLFNPNSDFEQKNKFNPKAGE